MFDRKIDSSFFFIRFFYIKKTNLVRGILIETYNRVGYGFNYHQFPLGIKGDKV